MCKNYLVYCFDEKDRLHYSFIKASSFKYAINKAYRMGYKLCTDYNGCKEHLSVINRREKK